MKRILIIAALLVIVATGAQAQKADRLQGQELSFNFFRNPSTGLEYRRNHISIHAGFYPTILPNGVNDADVDNSFFRAGLTYWFLPIGKREELPSSFYASASSVWGTAKTPLIIQGALLETGVRLYIWEGFHFRLGVAALISKDNDVFINPTPGIGYSLRLK